MKNGYKEFVEELRQELIAATGFEEGRIYLKKDEAYPQTSGDRIFLEYAVGLNSREVLGLYAEKLYENYCSGITIGEMVQRTVEDLEKIKAAGMTDKARDLHDYEKIRSALFIRLLNLEKNRETLKHGIYRVIGDIAMVLYLRMGSLNGVITSLKVRKEMVTGWGQNCEEVFEKALENTYSLTPPRIFKLEKMIFNPDYNGDDFMDVQSDFQLDSEDIGNCLSTSERINGAVAVFLPGVAERLAELIGGGYWILFTSIHEVMIHAEETAEPEELRRILRETIEESTPEEDFLTYNIYRYDKENGKISMVELDEE